MKDQVNGYITYLLTPWCRVLPEQLTGLQLVKKFPAFHRTRRFITALTIYIYIYTHTYTYTDILVFLIGSANSRRVAYTSVC